MGDIGWRHKGVSNIQDIRYRKKKPSDKSKAKRKSNHKHNYEQYLISHGDVSSFLSLGRICTICNKSNIVKYYITKRLSDGRYQQLSNTEVLEKYKHLKIIDEKELENNES